MSQPEQGKTRTAELQADKARLIELLGKTMYIWDIVNVTIKELFQNSFDAVKAAQHRGLIENGRIDITTDIFEHAINVKDNGIGMTADTVQKAFFTIAGTEKSDLPPHLRSGGLGLAKMAFIFGSESISLTTVRDGVKTEVSATSERIRNGTFEITERPTDEPNGTSISVKMPKSVPAYSGDGETPIQLPSDASFVQALRAFFTGKQTDVTFNGKPVENRPQRDKVHTAELSWGKVDIYFQAMQGYSSKQQVLSAGVYQFGERFFKPGAPSEIAPFDVVLDVYTNVLPTDPSYPFNNQREGWRITVNKDVNKVREYVDDLIADEYLKDVIEKFSDLKVMQRVDPLQPTQVGPDWARQIELQPLKGTGVKPGIFMADMSGLPPSEPLLHSNLNVNLPAQLNLDLINMNERPTAGQFFSELGSAVVQFTEAAAKIPGYEGLAEYRSGITLDKGHAGVNIKVPFEGLFINPFYTSLFGSMETPRGIAGAMLHVLKHEAVHEVSGGHGDDFVFRLSQLDGALHDSGDQDKLLDTLTNLVKRHETVFKLGSLIYDRPTTTNAHKSIDGSWLTAGADGTSARDVAGGDSYVQSPRSEPGIPAGVARTADATRDAGSRAHTRDSQPIVDSSLEVRQFSVREYRRMMAQQAQTDRPAAHGKSLEYDHGM